MAVKTETERERERETDRQTDRQTDFLYGHMIVKVAGGRLR